MTKTKQALKIKRETNDITFSIAIDTKLREALEERAYRDRRSMSFVAREALEQYLAIERASAA